MAVSSLTAANPNPSDAEIDASINNVAAVAPIHACEERFAQSPTPRPEGAPMQISDAGSFFHQLWSAAA